MNISSFRKHLFIFVFFLTASLLNSASSTENKQKITVIINPEEYVAQKQRGEKPILLETEDYLKFLKTVATLRCLLNPGEEGCEYILKCEKEKALEEQIQQQLSLNKKQKKSSIFSKCYWLGDNHCKCPPNY